MSRLILPGPQPPRGGLTLFVPRGTEQRKTGECYLCGEDFAPGDDVVKHMRTCVNAAGHDVRADEYEKRDRLEIFHEEAWDPEVAAHLRRVGQTMIREGRLEVKPSERAGFS